MATIIKNHIGIIVTIATYLLTAAVSLGAAQVIIQNLKENQCKLESTFVRYGEKVDDRLREHDQRITKVETLIEVGK